MDDVEYLRKSIIVGKSEVDVMRATGWSRHRIKRIRERAFKDGRPLPRFKEDGDDSEAK